MADAQAKEVKVSFSVDTGKADKLRQVIQAITNDIEKLVAATQKIGFGGISGGGAKVSNFSGSTGVGSASTQAGAKLRSGPVNDVVDGLTRAVSNSSALFKNASTGAIGSFKIMGDSLRQMVSTSDKEITRLQGSLSKLETTFSKLKTQQKAGISGPGMDAVISQNQQRYYEDVGQLNKAYEAKKGFESQIRQMNPTFGDKVKGFFGIPQGGFQPGTNPMSMIGSVAGSPGGAIMAGIGTGYKASQYLAGAGNEFSSTNVGFALNSPMIQMQNAAMAGQVFGGMAVRARGGAVSQTMAFNQLMQQGFLSDIMGSKAAENLVAKIKLENPVGLIDSVSKGRGFGTALKQGAGKYYSKAQAALFGSGVEDRAGDLTGQQITQAQLLKAVPQEYMGRIQQAIQAKEAENPLLHQLANNIFSGAFGDIGGINASRTSGNVIRDKNGKPINVDYDLLRSRIERNLFNPDEVFGMMGSLSPVLGRKLSGVGNAERMLSMNIGGFGSASNVFAAGSQYGRGQSGGNALIKAFQSRIGGRGVDIGAGSMVGSLVSSSMMSGNFMGNAGTGLASTLLEATATGNPGSEMRNARMMQAGLGSMDQFANGGLDPLQGAINMSAALQVAGNMPWQTKKELMKLDSASLIDIVRTGKLPPQLAGTGISVDMVRKYVNARTGMEFARVNDVMLTPETLGAVQKYRKSGISYLKGMNRKDQNRELGLLAHGLSLGTGHSFEADFQELKIEAAMARVLPSVKGSGAGRSISKKALAAVGAVAHGDITKGVGTQKADNEPLLKRSIAETPNTVTTYDDERSKAVADLGAKIQGAAVKASSALKEMADIIAVMGQVATDPLREAPVAHIVPSGTGRGARAGMAKH